MIITVIVATVKNVVLNPKCTPQCILVLYSKSTSNLPPLSLSLWFPPFLQPFFICFYKFPLFCHQPSSLSLSRSPLFALMPHSLSIFFLIYLLSFAPCLLSGFCQFRVCSQYFSYPSFLLLACPQLIDTSISTAKFCFIVPSSMCSAITNWLGLEHKSLRGFDASKSPKLLHLFW